MYKKILVPLDGSKMSECALDQAKDIAAGCHVPEVVLLAVVEPAEQVIPWLYNEPASSEDSAAIKKELESYKKADERAVIAAGEYLKTVADGLPKDVMSVKTQVVEGKAADLILDYANNNNCDIIVMSSHGNGKTRFDFGKVTDRIIRNSNLPVIVASPPGCRR